MLETPILIKVVPLAIAGMVALSPISYDLAKIQKDSYSHSNENMNSNTETENDKTNKQTTTIVTIREGYKGVIHEGVVLKIPYFQKTTVEKTYNEVEKEKEKLENKSDSFKQDNNNSVEEIPRQHETIISHVFNGTMNFAGRIWSKFRP